MSIKLCKARVTRENVGCDSILKWEGPISGIAEISDMDRCIVEDCWPIEVLDYDFLFCQILIQRLDHGFYWFNRMHFALYSLGRSHYYARCRLIAWLTQIGIGYRDCGSKVQWSDLWTKKPKIKSVSQSRSIKTQAIPLKMRDVLKLAREMGYRG